MTNQRASSALGLNPAAQSSQRWSLHISLGLRCCFPSTVFNETQPPSIISGLWVEAGRRTSVHPQVSIASFVALTLTDKSWFLGLLLTLWEGWGLLTWSQRTWGPPRFGKYGKEASLGPVVEKGGTHVLVTIATCKVTSSHPFSTKPFSWPGWQNQFVILSHCTVSGMRRWGGGVVAVVGKEVSEPRITARQRKMRRGG